MINAQLSSHGVRVQREAVVEVSITPTAKVPQGEKNDDLQENGRITALESDQKGVDPAANWAATGDQLYDGNKRHLLMERQGGCLRAELSVPKAILS